MLAAFAPPAEPWRRNLFALRITGFTAYLGFVFASPLLPLYLAELLGPGGDVDLWTGITFAVSPLLGAITGPIWGHVADRFGPKAMLQRSILAIGIAMALTAFATSAWHVLGCRVLFGLLGGFTVSSIAAVTASTPRREMAAALGSFQAAQTLGLVAGPLLGGLLADAFGVRVAFLVSGLFFMPALLVVQRLYRDIPHGTLDPGEGDASAGPPGRASLFHVLAAAPALLLVMATLYWVNFAEAGLGPLMPLLLARAGAPAENLATSAGATVSGASLGAAVSAYLFGRLASRLGTRQALLPILLGGAVCTGLLALAASWWQLAAGRVLLGLVVGGAPTLVYATAAQLGGSQRGAAMGFVSSAGLLGFASGPLATGASARLADAAVFAVVAAAYCIAAALTLVRRRG